MLSNCKPLAKCEGILPAPPLMWKDVLVREWGAGSGSLGWWKMLMTILGFLSACALSFSHISLPGGLLASYASEEVLSRLLS